MAINLPEGRAVMPCGGSSSGGGDFPINVTCCDSMTFLKLLDTPDTYDGSTTYFVTVNAAGDALEFIDINNYPGKITATGFERITEGGNTGRALIDRIPENYGDIGENAVDGSYNPSASSIAGATGSASMAFGQGGNIASGRGAGVGGYGSTASGSESFAWGMSAEATHYGAVAFGVRTEAVNGYSFACGYETSANGSWSFASGRSTDASGSYSTALNQGTQASGDKSLAIGGVTYAKGLASFAGGIGNTAGTGTTAEGQTSFTFMSAGLYAVSSRNRSNFASILGGEYHNIGLNAESSGIFGGYYNVINSGAERSVILGGSTIVATLPDFTYVPSLNIDTTPAAYISPGSTVQGLVRNPATGSVEEYTFPIGGSGGYHKYIITDNSFSVGDVLAYYSGSWQAADTTLESHTAQGMVVEIRADGTAVLIRYGDVTITTHGYALNSWYWLDETGSFVTPAPNEDITQVVFYVKDANTIQINIEQPNSGISGIGGAMSKWVFNEGAYTNDIEDENIVEFIAGTNITLSSVTTGAGGTEMTINSAGGGTGVDNFDDLTDTVNTKGDFGQVVEVVDDGGGGKELGYNSVPEISSEDTLSGRMALAVVTVMPGSPDANTIYFIAL